MAGLQARMSENDPRLYNVNRDVAHNFGDVVREVAGRLEDARWPIIAEICKHYNVTEDQLGLACEAFCKFVASSVEVPKERMNEALARCGWFNVPEAAQVAYMAYLGTVMAGYFYAGVREATLAGVGPAQTYQDLREVGSRASKLLTSSRWRRRLAAFGNRFRRAFRLIFKGE